ncbi:MAG: sugar phosphate nucleotidyltransferase [Patescibacteria group bacterium]|nr:sugar phosphate nucleotidyltransferase [Patescibacteria group bacterium]
MKLVIFAGGIGTRLWPLSRENSPKQFDKIFNGKSTLQLAVERVKDDFDAKDIYIQTVGTYKSSVKEQIPDIADENIIIEPERRNLGPAVCLTAVELNKRGYDGPMVILWADHLMERPGEFIKALKYGEKLINKQEKRFVFLGERPRFANNNLGWMKIGKKAGGENGNSYFEFKGWKYKPSSKECNVLFKSDQAYWNPGYFITSVNFLLDQYKTLAPGIYDCVVNNRYGEAEPKHFDRVIIEKVDLSSAIVIKTDMGWSDPGTLYALKEALGKTKEDNVTLGEVELLDVADSLVYNFEKNKIVTSIGVEGMVIVNTEDALIVVPKDEVVRVTDLVKQLRSKDKNQYL